MDADDLLDLAGTIKSWSRTNQSGYDVLAKHLSRSMWLTNHDERIRAAERERIATTIKNTPTPHDVFLANESGTWIKARRLFEALARNPEEPT
jgi:hypothetical protein